MSVISEHLIIVHTTYIQCSLFIRISSTGHSADAPCPEAKVIILFYLEGGDHLLLEDESHVIKWLSQYGALPKTQLLRMLRKPPRTAEKILDNLKRDMRIADIGDGYYCALDPLAKPDQRIVLAVWVLLQFIDFVEPMAHYPAVYPSQLFFLKENMGYEIVVLYEGEKNLLRLLQPQEDLKYVIVLPHISMAAELRLPKAPCLFATVEFQGADEPNVLFYSEEILQDAANQLLY